MVLCLYTKRDGVNFYVMHVHSLFPFPLTCEVTTLHNSSSISIFQSYSHLSFQVDRKIPGRVEGVENVPIEKGHFQGRKPTSFNYGKFESRPSQICN